MQNYRYDGTNRSQDISLINFNLGINFAKDNSVQQSDCVQDLKAGNVLNVRH